MPKTFQGLCRELCKAAGVPQTSILIDSADRQVFRLRMDGVEFKLHHEPARSDAVMTEVVFGPLPPDNVVPACRALMDVNSIMLWSASSFGRDPATGEIVLRYPCPLQSTNGQDICMAIRELAEVARAWRRNSFLSPAGTSPIPSLIAAFSQA